MKPYIFKVAFSAFLFIHTIIASAQVAAVKFIVHTPAISKGDMRVYIAGSFNYWHEGDSLYRMNEISNGVYTITIPVFEATQYNYKYTLGTWGKVEVALNDSDISNRRFISMNGKSITDTVVKWKQPQTKVTDSSAQLKRMVAMKDSLAAKLKPELAEIMDLVKLYAQNMLKEKPDLDEHKQLDAKAIQKIGNIYSEVTHLLFNIIASLSPEQKQQISKAISQPANGDFLNSFLGAVGAAVK
jgi:hypothetical protein